MTVCLQYEWSASPEEYRGHDGVHLSWNVVLGDWVDGNGNVGVWESVEGAFRRRMKRDHGVNGDVKSGYVGRSREEFDGDILSPLFTYVLNWDDSVLPD